MYKKFKWLTVLIACAGCYDRMSGRRGLDINKALLTSLDVKSSESKASIRFEVVPSDKALSTEDKEAIDLINSLSLNMDHAIVQDSKTVSIQGDPIFGQEDSASCVHGFQRNGDSIRRRQATVLFIDGYDRSRIA